jgi:secondary thiamine-phosphate synthase enzyme
MIFQNTFTVRTTGRGTTDITGRIEQIVRRSGIAIGLCHAFIQHTSASLVLCENADPAVRGDLETFLGRLVQDGDPIFRHDTEGRDDMPAHIRSILTDTSLNLPVSNGNLALGTWQGVYLYEHRASPHDRHILVTVFGNK